MITSYLNHIHCYQWLITLVLNLSPTGMHFSEDLLVESPTARNEGLSEIKSQSREQEILNKVKALIFAVWNGTHRISRQQLADFYEVPVSTIDSNYQRHKDEFILDGVEVLRGKDLTEVRRILPLTSSTPQEAIYTPAGALRMGFILRGSQVAKQVRTTSIRVIQGISDFIDSQAALIKLIEGHAGLEVLAENNLPKVSAPLFGHYEAVKHKLKAAYPDGGIPGFTTDKIREVIAFLATYTDRWKMQTDKEVRSSHSSGRYGCPHLTSDVFNIEINGQSKSAVVMFQFYDLVVDDRDIADVDGSRRYIRSAKTDLGVDLAWLFFVSPFGATPEAVSFIESELREDSNGFVGVLTVKELAQLLHTQACHNRSSNVIRGAINSRFKNLLGYEIPDSPLALLMEYQMPLLT